ncbi:MAG: hypothetical protein QGH60_13590 [Phycisphaerae bacterium]|nr:hypothetical protein [Phycisphaerae bacterium]
MATVALTGFSADLRAAEGNLVANGSFEAAGGRSATAKGWYGSEAVYSRDAGVARTGKASLKYVNTDTGRYQLCSRSVPLRAGWKCRFSVWVKTKNIAGNDSGASICLEWSRADGKWMGGTYPHGVKGTRGWTKIEAVTRIPPEAARFSLTCYVRKGMTGTAWFDDVELVRVAEKPMKTMLLSPVYRGRITSDGPRDVRVGVRLNLRDHDLLPKQVKVSARIVSVKGDRSSGLTTFQPRDKAAFVLSLRAGDLAPGRYRLIVSLTGPGDKVIQTLGHDLVRTPDDFAPTCTIDAHRRLIVRGKPFFPLGMYWSSINAKELGVYAASRFNCIMPYGRPTKAQMDLAHKHGIKVIYSIKDLYAGSKWSPADIKTPADEERKVRATVRRFRDHPALLAWYLNDELPQSYMPRLVAHRKWTAQEDANHPAWVVLYQYREVADYIETFDVIGTDPYPIASSPASMAGRWTAETFDQTGRARPIWQVPQLHNWANYRKTASGKKAQRTPTRDEVRSMAWQCICNGATGLVFYSWFDVRRNPDVSFETQWTYLKAIAAEIDSAAPMLLSTKPPPAVQARIDPTKPTWLHWLARTHKGKGYIFAVNNGDADGTVTFTLGKGIRTVRVAGSDRTIGVKGGRFSDTFKKLQVRIYELTY